MDKHILFPFWSEVDQSTLRCVPAQGRQVSEITSELTSIKQENPF